VGSEKFEILLLVVHYLILISGLSLEVAGGMLRERWLRVSIDASALMACSAVS
jgi:hypothetical protein